MDAILLARKTAAGASMIALLAAASLVYAQHERNYDKAYAPLMKYGSVGQAVNAGPFSVKVDKVTVAKSVVSAEYGQYEPPTRATPGMIFVVVDGRETATKDGTKLSSVVLRHGGTTYDLADRFPGEDFSDSTAQPGYWITGAWLFEIPRSALGGAQLQIGDQTENDVPRGTFPHLGFEFNPGADVDLGLDDPDSLIAHAKEKAGYREAQG